MYLVHLNLNVLETEKLIHITLNVLKTEKIKYSDLNEVQSQLKGTWKIEWNWCNDQLTFTSMTNSNSGDYNGRTSTSGRIVYGSEHLDII